MFQTGLNGWAFVNKLTVVESISVAVTETSGIMPDSNKEFLAIQATTKCLSNAYESSESWAKFTVNRKDKTLTKMELRQTSLPWKLLRFLKVILNGVFQKFISTDKQIFNISNKVTSIDIYRSSRRRCSIRKGVLRNFGKVIGKCLCQSLYFNKARPATLLKQRLWHRCFPMNFAKLPRTLFFAVQIWATASKYKEIFYVFDLKNKIFAGITSKVFAINRTDNYYRETAPYIIIFSTVMTPKLGNKYC